MTSRDCITLDKWAEKYGDEDKTSVLVELLAQSNPLLDDMLFEECNEGTSHVKVLRTSLRSLHGHDPRVRFATGNMDAYSDVDKALMDQVDSAKRLAFRNSEDVAVLEAVGQEMQRQVFYGDMVKNPAEFIGLSQFYNTTNPDEAQNAVCVVDAGGRSNKNTSIWFVVWSPYTAFGIFPNGSKAGLLHMDMGEVDSLDNTGNKYRCLRSFFKWDCGLALADWRYIIRIANIDVEALAGPSPPHLYDLMKQALELLPKRRPDGARLVCYMNRTIRFWMDAQGMRDRNEMETVSIAGVPQDTFGDGVMRVMDVIRTDEETVA